MLDLTTSSTVGPSAPKLGYEPISTPGQRSPASIMAGAITLSRVLYNCRHVPIGLPLLNSSAIASNIASISAGRPGMTYTFSIAKPGAPPSGFESGRLPSGSCAQRTA